MKHIGIVGGGAAGMMAAYAAAGRGYRVSLFEKNEKLGKKIYITGKGRCNITNAAPIEDFFEKIVTHGSFLYSALYTFSNVQLVEMLRAYGLETQVERGGRVFPVSGKSSDVIRTLEKAVKQSGAVCLLNENVLDILIEKNCAVGLVCGGRSLFFDSVIIATGGRSYPATGSTGDGYTFAQRAGHKIIAPQPSLVAVDTTEDVSALAGLTLKNVTLTLMQGKHVVYKEQGEMLFTHTGVSGPMVLSASAYMNEEHEYKMIVDFKPALDGQTLDARLIRDFTEKSNKDFSNVLGGLLPAKMIPLIIANVGIDADKKAHSITREERKALMQALKAFPLTVKGKRPIDEAVVTRGGVDVGEVDPSTMQSRICSGLYFAGEVLDVDALTGGYNLQIAFSTGYLAGLSC